MLSWKMWVVIGASGAATAVAIGVLAMNPVVRSTARPPDWNTSAVSIVSGKATTTYAVTADAPAGELRFAGYSLGFTVQNNTNRDITIPADATIMRRLYDGGALVDFSGFAKPFTAAFVPANQRAEIDITVDWNCYRVDAHGVGHEGDPEACYRDMWSTGDPFELFDRANHLQVSLPKPALENVPPQ
jgi:hypothetical protein